MVIIGDKADILHDSRRERGGSGGGEETVRKIEDRRVRREREGGRGEGGRREGGGEREGAGIKPGAQTSTYVKI